MNEIDIPRDSVSGLPYEDILRLSGGTRVDPNADPLGPGTLSARAIAQGMVRNRDRSLSVKPDNSPYASFAGEGLKAPMLLAKEAVQKKLMPLGVAFDALGNTWGSVSATGAGNDRYGDVVMGKNGMLELKNPRGVDAASIARDTAESLISAAQWTKVGAIPASLFAGELTEKQIHQANRNKSPYLKDIAALRNYSGEDNQYNTLIRAVENMRVMNTSAQEPGKLGGALWEGVRNDLQKYVNNGLNAVSKELGSGDEKRVSAAAIRISELAELMDMINYDLEALQTSSQEFTWPWARFGQWASDELTPGLVSAMSAGGLDGTGGGLNYISPDQAREALPPTRPQGANLLRETHQRALRATGGVEPRQYFKERDERGRSIDQALEKAMSRPDFYAF